LDDKQVRSRSWKLPSEGWTGRGIASLRSTGLIWRRRRKERRMDLNDDLPPFINEFAIVWCLTSVLQSELWKLEES